MLGPDSVVWCVVSMVRGVIRGVCVLCVWYICVMLLLVVSVSVGTIPCVKISFVVSICVYMVVVFLLFLSGHSYGVVSVCVSYL